MPTGVFGGGVTAVDPTGQIEQADFFAFLGNDWVIGSEWSIAIGYNGISYIVGAGEVTGVIPTYLLTLNNRLYFTSGSVFYFSALADPTGWNTQNTGAGSIEAANRYSQPEPLQALASYQGRLAVFSSKSVQIWTVNADPALFQLNQILSNIGTFAPLSVVSAGDLDVYFLSDTGIRSLRARDLTLNAFVNDKGSPIDDIVRAKITVLGGEQRALCCGVMEPTENRYWCYIPNTAVIGGTICTFTDEPSSKVAAWSFYEPTYNANAEGEPENQVPFTPQKFVVFNGQVIARTGIGLVSYGGITGVEYDRCELSGQIPWLDNKTPATNKMAKAFDCICSGVWLFSVSMDYLSDQFKEVGMLDHSTTEQGRIAVAGVGTHFSLKFSTKVAEKATLSSLIFHFEQANTR